MGMARHPLRRAPPLIRGRDVTIPTLTAAQLAPMIREAMKDQSYRATPLGLIVARYMRWLRNEFGATPSTQRDYEAILARMCLTLADRELIEVSTKDLRVIDLWSAKSARTRQKVTSVVRSFWAWCEEEGHIAISPAARIRRPRAERKVARTLPADARPKLLRSALHPRDRVGLHCLLGLGLRRAELGAIQIHDFDVQRGTLRAFGKGQKERLLPMSEAMLAELRLMLHAPMPFMDRPPEGDDYLIYPVRRVPAGRGSEGQFRVVYIPEPKTKPSVQTVHRWWYRMAANAGLVAGGVTSGLNMHQARHTFATELRRVAGIDAASQALGHSDLSTTLGIYGHYDGTDLRDAMKAHAEWVAEQDD
jgi:integrase/recombinase XerC